MKKFHICFFDARDFDIFNIEVEAYNFVHALEDAQSAYDMHVDTSRNDSVEVRIVRTQP